MVADHSACQAGESCSTYAAALQERMRAVLSYDLLTPLVTAMLFPDLLQQFLPFPVQAYDRARALGYGFENLWRGAKPPGCIHCDGERFADDFRNLGGNPQAQSLRRGRGREYFSCDR
jgi:hypothetical protein